jgi:hypothetical protein
MSNERNLFSITDNGEGIAIKCEAEGWELVRTFSALIRTSHIFRATIKTAIEMAEQDVETGLEESSHNEFVIPNNIKGDA